MISRVDLRGAGAGASYRDVLPRAALDVEVALDVVRPICEDVRLRGAEAVREWTQRLDRVDAATTRVPPEALAAALEALDPAVRAALEEAARRARTVHEAQRREDAHVQVSEGGTVTERWVPVRRVGLYVPGGLVAYPSSVVMDVVPAQVSGAWPSRARRSGTTTDCRTRSSSRRVPCSASRRCTRSAAPRRSRCSPTAPTTASRPTW